MSRDSFARGLSDGAQKCRRIMRDPDYDLAYELIAHDVGYHLAQYDRGHYAQIAANLDEIERSERATITDEAST